MNMKKLILLSLMVSAAHCHAMKRQLVHTQQAYNQKRRKITPALPVLPQDMLKIVFNMAIHNLDTKKPREAARTVRTLAVTNKALNKKINAPDFSDNLIHKLSFRFSCSHESIARFLATKQAKKRLKLQYELKNLCKDSSSMITSKSLYTLIEKKVDLDFTFNDCGLQKTALMISIHRNTWTFVLLLESNANINTRNSHGMTLLHCAASLPIQLSALEKIIARPTLQVDQQNNRGETALLYSLKDRRKTHITYDFIRFISQLLEKADPEIVDKQGDSPLFIAKELDNYRIIELIHQAIEKKHAQPKQITAQ